LRKLASQRWVAWAKPNNGINEERGSGNCNGFAVASRARSACSNASLVWVECWPKVP